MKIVANPFYRILETDTSPYARTLRATFWQKCQYTFEVFAGDVPFLLEDSDPDSAKHIGLLDVLTIGIPLGLSRLIYDLCRSNHLVGKFLGYILTLFVSIPLLIVRYLLAAILTVPIMLLVIPIVHLASQYIADGAELKDRALNLTLTQPEGAETRLSQILGDGDDITDLQVEINAYQLTLVPRLEEGDNLAAGTFYILCGTDRLLHYSVLDPQGHPVVNQTISKDEFTTKFGQRRYREFTEALQKDDLETALQPFLPNILEITSEKGDTQLNLVVHSNHQAYTCTLFPNIDPRNRHALDAIVQLNLKEVTNQLEDNYTAMLPRLRLGG